jgi:hypothetical protein
MNLSGTTPTTTSKFHLLLKPSTKNEEKTSLAEKLFPQPPSQALFMTFDLATLKFSFTFSESIQEIF